MAENSIGLGSGWGVRVAAAALLLAITAACGGEQGHGQSAPAAAAPELPARAVAAAPSSGMDSTLLAEALTQAERMPRLYSLTIARHGEVQAERRFRGPALDAPTNVKSVSKSVLSALVGIAIAEGRLQGPEQPIAPFFRGHLGEDSADKADITVGNLLSMQAGLEPTSFGNYGRWVSSPDWVRYVLTRPMVDAAGGRMLYSTGSSHLLSAIVTQVAEQSTWAYAQVALADPLGISLPRWPTDPQGIFFGGNEMRLSPRALLRFGELYRNGGVHEGRQVVPAEWIRESWRVRTRSPFNGYGYGYGWWIRRAGPHPVYFAWGYGGQFVFVIPDLQLTVVATSNPGDARDGGHLRAVHDLIDRHIVPAAEAGR
jgi:CubicO group peptidase (beta-lactamase class C family)